MIQWVKINRPELAERLMEAFDHPGITLYMEIAFHAGRELQIANPTLPAGPINPGTPLNPITKDA